MNIFILSLFMFATPWLVYGQENSRIDSLKMQLAGEIHDSTRVLVAIDLSRAYHDEGHHDADYSYAIQAAEQAELLNDSLIYARALDNLGLIYRFHQHYAKSLPLHIKAYDLVKGKNVLPYYKMRFANNAAVAARYDQLYDQAVSYFIEAFKVAEMEGDLRNIAISSNGLGNTFINIPEREEEALQYFLQALRAEEQQQNNRGIAINYLSIADYFTQDKEYDTARVYLEKLLKLNQEMGDSFGLGMTYEFYGRNYYQEGHDLEEAKAFYIKALMIFQKINNRSKQADVYYALGDLFLKEGSLDVAKDQYQKSLELAKELNHKQLIKDNAGQLAQLYEETLNPTKALDYYKIAQIYKDSINLVEQETKIAGIKLSYDFEKKEGEIALLKKDKDIQEAQIYIQTEALKKQKAIVSLILSGFVVALLFFLLIYRNLNLKKNARLSLQEQVKKRLQTEYENNLLQAEILASRMQMNPHFLFNCLNSIKYLIQKENFKEAINYLTVFSRFVRSVLETGKKKEIPLNEELELIRKYVQLEENRFDQNFTFNIKYVNVEPADTACILIPPMLLQPFVENAIWHGLLPSKKEKKILEIEIVRDQMDGYLIIKDNGVGRNSSKLGPTVDLHKSLGTRITQDRIDLFNKTCKSTISFEIVDLYNDLDQAMGTKVILSLKGIIKQEFLNPNLASYESSDY
jgi:tetratricopeptide (TPR) repeat protein